LAPGNITYEDLVATTPFENNLWLVAVPGLTIRQAFESGVSNSENLAVVQASGVKVTFDLSRDPFDRIVDIKVLCQKCDIPRYEALDDKKIYKIVISDYVAEGGAGFTMFPGNIVPGSKIIGLRDVDALANYIESISPINVPPALGRIKFI
jgi:2',3'-cyclic-nucleotide 2'-phosphodiesterase (5'-nucleotidase family)